MILALILAALTPAFAADAENTAFGAPLTVRETVPLAEALARPEAFRGKEIAVEGLVTKACREKGCWMILTDGEAETRVTFKGYGFFVPKELRDRRARVQGVVKRETLPARTVRHYLKDEGAPKAEVEKVKKPVQAVTFVASGVALLPPAGGS